MATILRRGRSTSAEDGDATEQAAARAREALTAALEDPIFEVLPLSSLPDQVGYLPAGARVSVTASLSKGLDATIEWAGRLQADGFRVMPHLAARMIPDQAALDVLLRRAEAAGISRAFIVGGDPPAPGAFPDGLSLLRAMGASGHPFRTLGCPAYPKGHPIIADDDLETALYAKAPFVDHVTTQMDFDTKAIASWVRQHRAAGLTPDTIIGVPGVVDPQRLLRVAARIGVADAKRFLVKNLRFVTGLAKSGGFYKPTRFVEDLAPLLSDPDARVTGFHLYTFNAVEATEAWRRSMLER